MEHHWNGLSMSLNRRRVTLEFDLCGSEPLIEYDPGDGRGPFGLTGVLRDMRSRAAKLIRPIFPSDMLRDDLIDQIASHLDNRSMLWFMCSGSLALKAASSTGRVRFCNPLTIMLVARVMPEFLDKVPWMGHDSHLQAALYTKSAGLQEWSRTLATYSRKIGNWVTPPREAILGTADISIDSRYEILTRFGLLLDREVVEWVAGLPPETTYPWGDNDDWRLLTSPPTLRPSRCLRVHNMQLLMIPEVMDWFRAHPSEIIRIEGLIPPAYFEMALTDISSLTYLFLSKEKFSPDSIPILIRHPKLLKAYINRADNQNDHLVAYVVALAGELN